MEERLWNTTVYCGMVGWLVNNELARIWSEVVVSSFELLSWNFLEWLRKITKKKVRTASALASVHTGYLPNACQQQYHSSQHAQLHRLQEHYFNVCIMMSFSELLVWVIWCPSVTQMPFLFVVLMSTGMLIISYKFSYACPCNLVSYSSNCWFNHASGAEPKFGSQKLWQWGNSSEMIIGRTEHLLLWAGVRNTHPWYMYLVVHRDCREIVCIVQ
jgi:hypothetical protein